MCLATQGGDETPEECWARIHQKFGSYTISIITDMPIEKMHAMSEEIAALNKPWVDTHPLKVSWIQVQLLPDNAHARTAGKHCGPKALRTLRAGACCCGGQTCGPGTAQGPHGGRACGPCTIKNRERGIQTKWTNWKHAAHADRYRYCCRSWDLVSFNIRPQ